MKKADLKIFLGKKVRVNVTYVNGTILNYTGSIRELNADHMLFLDKFDKIIMLRYEVVTSVAEVPDDG